MVRIILEQADELYLIETHQGWLLAFNIKDDYFAYVTFRGKMEEIRYNYYNVIEL